MGKYNNILSSSFTKFILSSIGRQDSDKKLVTIKVTSFYEALVKHDYVKFDHFMENEFLFIYSDYLSINKLGFIDKLKRKSFKSIKVTNQSILFMLNVATVKHQISIFTNYNIINLNVKMIWMKENNRWVLWRIQAFNF